MKGKKTPKPDVKETLMKHKEEGMMTGKKGKGSSKVASPKC